MRVFIYWNLHKNLWSVKALDGVNKGKVVIHAHQILVRDAEFQVSEAGRKRVVETGRKTVHAGIVGTLDAFGVTNWERVGADTFDMSYRMPWRREDGRYMAMAKRHGMPTRYNPKRAPWFETNHGTVLTPQWVRSNGSPMVALAATGGVPLVLSFDPCAIPA